MLNSELTSSPDALDATDRKILDLIQTSFPLSPRPFAEIAQSIALSEADVLARITAMKAPPRPAIRQISAIFDSRSLGYQSTLVAAKVLPEKLEAAAAAINRHPGVSHNYQRNHAYNLWYTLAVGPDSSLGLARTVDLLHRQSGAIATHILPATRMFKIGVKFDMAEGETLGRTDSSGVAESRPHRPIGPQDQQLIRILQQDVPMLPCPFDQWADQAEMAVDELLAKAEKYQRDGLMRRFSAVLRHRDIGFSANGMGVWNVPAGGEQAFGDIAATFAAVSHCYQRPTFDDWTYNLFTMVHAPSAAACEAVLAEISRATAISDYAVLYSGREFKKKRVQYFTPDIAEWERAQGAALADISLLHP